MNGQAVGFAVAFLAAFVIGLVLGVLGCAGAIKFVEWMRGRALFFTPWPRVQRADIQPVPGNRTWQNPTYETNSTATAASASAIKQPKEQPCAVSRLRGEDDHSSSLMVVLEKGLSSGGHKLETHMEVNEPVTEEELQLDAWSPHQAQPYAVHDFSDDKPDAEPPKPVKYKKDKGKGKDKSTKATAKAASGGKASSKQHQGRQRPQVPQRPSLDQDFNGAYSELNKKGSYASLEPHTGLSTIAREHVTDSYGHLNH